MIWKSGRNYKAGKSQRWSLWELIAYESQWQEELQLYVKH